MGNSVKYNESALWIAASIAVAIAIVFGHALDNTGEVFFSDLVRPTLFLSVVSITLVVLCSVACRPLVKFVPAGLYITFSFLAVNSWLPDMPLKGYVTLVILAFPLIVLYFSFRHRDPFTVAKVNFQITFLVAISTIFIACMKIGITSFRPVFDKQFSEELAEVVAAKRDSKTQYPDIFYIVPDRYGSADTLLTEFGFDNSEFYSELRNRGFTVVENGFANYPKTFQSLASAMNAEYLDGFSEAARENSIDQKPVFEALENNLAQDKLRRLAYQFINMGNFWAPTERNDYADENYLGYRQGDLRAYMTEFESTLMLKSPTPQVLRIFNSWNFDSDGCTKIKNKFSRLQSIGNSEEPQFVFSHFLIPHTPVLMDRNGKCISSFDYDPELDNWKEFKSAYVGYLQYFNSAILKVIDSQEKSRAQSGRPFIFVIQSDEGPFPRSMRRGKHDFYDFFDRELLMKMGNINAIRLDAPERIDAEDMKTPVNNWRIIMQSLLKHDFPKLEHRSYIYPENDIYKFCDISSVLGLNSEPQDSCR